MSLPRTVPCVITDAEGYFNFLGWRPGSEEVGNIVTYSRDNYDNIAAMSEGGKYDVVGDLRYQNMTDDEVAIYNYLLAKEGKEKAGAFLSYVEEDLNAREGKRIADLVTSIDIPVVEELVTGLYGIGAGIDQWISGTRQLFTNEQLPITITQYANSEIADSLDGFGKNLYTGANVIGNMAPSILLSYVSAGVGAPAAVAQGVGAAAVGMSAAGNAYGSALRDGYGVVQARAYSTLVGAAEGTLQYILGGIGSLGGITDDLIKAKINMIDNSLLRISAKLGVDAFSEITEEELQNFLEPAFRSIIFGEEYDAPTVDEMIETAIVTAGTTLLLGGGDTVSGDLSENMQLVASGQKIMGTDGGMDALMKLANEVAGVSSVDMQNALTKQIAKVNQNPTTKSVGQLNTTVQAANDQANASVNQEDVAKRLMDKGFYSKKAAGVAEAIAARLNGQELTRTQRSILNSAIDNPSVQNVISDMQKTLTSQINPVNQNTTARSVGQLNSTVQTANHQANASGNHANTVADQAAVAKSLVSKGITAQKATGIAEAIVARLNGQELTRSQRDVLRSELGRPSVQKVINDLLQKKSNGIDSVQKSVYDDSNIRDGLTNEESTALWNLANQSGDALRNHDYIPATEGSPVHQSQNASSEGVFEGNADVIDNIITDGSHLENGKLKPNVTYKTGEHDYFYTTNGDGLIVNVRTDDLQFKTHERRYRHNPKTYGKEPGDHAGHLIGDRFGGSPELDNLVSQAENVNRSEYRQIEEQWAKALKNGQKVTVNIDIHYDKGGVRPSSFDVSYTIDGKRYNRKISNQLGGSK